MSEASHSELPAGFARITGPRFWPANLALVLCLALGIWARFTGLLWDEGALLHPDERFLTHLALRVQWPPARQWFLSATSPLNPANLPDTHYVYGQVPLMLGHWAAWWTRCTADAQFLATGRLMAAIAETFTLLLVADTGRRLLGWRAGLAAAAVLALCPLHIQSAHFFTVDSFTTTFLALSWWWLALTLRGPVWLGVLGAGLFGGLALSCKVAAVFGLLPMLAWPYVRHETRNPAWWTAVLGLVIAVVTFRIFNPMAFVGEWGGGFLDWRLEPRWLRDMAQQGGITSGEVDVPFNMQWIGRTAWVYPLANLGQWAYGWPLLLLMFLGISGLWRQWPQQSLVQRKLFIALSAYALIAFLVQGAQFSKFTRYYLLIGPVVALLAGWAIVRPEGSRKLSAAKGAALTMATLWAMAVAFIYTREHPRLQATRWIWNNVPAGTVVATETVWDESLPLSWVPGPNGWPVETGLVRLDMETFAEDTPEKKIDLLAKLDGAQWIFISSPRSWASIPRWRERWPVTAAFYDRLFAGDLGFVLEKEFTNYPGWGPLRLPDWGVEEALTVYDHPRVMLFRKTEAWNHTKAFVMLPPGVNNSAPNWVPREARLTGALPVPPKILPGSASAPATGSVPPQ